MANGAIPAREFLRGCYGRCGCKWGRGGRRAFPGFPRRCYGHCNCQSGRGWQRATGRAACVVPTGCGTTRGQGSKGARNAEALGGLRNPNKAVAQLPALRAVGRRLRKVLENLGQCSTRRQAVRRVVQLLGAENALGFLGELVEDCRGKVQAESTGRSPATSTAKCGAPCSRQQRTPEQEVPGWRQHGRTTGIGESVLHGNGVFPKIDTTSAAIEEAKVFAQMRDVQGWHQEEHKNYKSFYFEQGAFATKEVDRIAAKGFVESKGSPIGKRSQGGGPMPRPARWRSFSRRSWAGPSRCASLSTC